MNFSKNFWRPGFLKNFLNGKKQACIFKEFLRCLSKLQMRIFKQFFLFGRPIRFEAQFFFFFLEGILGPYPWILFKNFLKGIPVPCPWIF